MAQIIGKTQVADTYLSEANLTGEQRLRFEEAKELDVVTRINHGEFDKVGLRSIRELFDKLDMDGSGGLDLDEVKLFLVSVMDPPCPPEAVEELERACQDTGGISISPEYFHSAVTTGPLRRLLHDELRHDAVQEIVARAKVAPIPRDFMVERFEWRVSRDDSLRILPFSLINLTVFISLVICHLRIWERQQVERGLEGHIAGWGFKYIGPYLQDHLPNLDQVYEWAEQSGLQVVFGYCHSTADKSIPAEFCELSPRNSLISDVMMRQERKNGGYNETWLLHSDVAKAHLATHPDEAYKAGLAELGHLRSTRWFDQLSNTFEMHFVTYNEKAKMFASNKVAIRFDDYGFATHSSFSWATPAVAYDRMGVFAADLLYVMMLLIPIKGEISEICTAVKNQGFKGFKNYWGFWNVVDWLMIINGLLIIQIWLQICFAIESTNIQGMLTGDDYKLRKDVMSLSLPVMYSLREDLATVLLLYRVMHMVMAFNTVAIMLKFFKAFQANARLHVVTETLVQGASDIFHFMMVFLAVFLCFVLTGHILFGGDMVHFNSFGAAFNTAFLVLMGDFGWYSDLTMEVEPLASGLPYTVVSIWFWSFMISSPLILLNMLLAIIMLHYGAVTEELAAMADAPTLVTQCTRYYGRARTYKAGGFTPLEHFCQELSNDDKDTHPGQLVSKESMQEAFPDMKPGQVTFLMNWLQKDANATAAKDADDGTTERLKEVHAMMKTIGENVHSTSMTVMRCENRLSVLEEACSNGTSSPQSLQPPDPSSRMDPSAIAWQLGSQQTIIEELRDQLERQQRSAEDMNVALEQFVGQGAVQGRPFDTQQQQLGQGAFPIQGNPAVRSSAPLQMPRCCSLP